jgi:hypothetical protein
MRIGKENNKARIGMVKEIRTREEDETFSVRDDTRSKEHHCWR